ncbi:MAG: molybdenum cofactor guanylyltransferase MobA [Rhodobacterales bacterium]
MPIEQVAGVILAGGQATRMGGGDKCLLPLGGGETVLERIVSRIGPQVGCLALNANGDPARFATSNLPVLPDTLTDAGPLAGVLAAMHWAQAQGCDAVVTVAGDTPFFPADLVARLVAERAGQPVVMAATDRLHPVFALWDISLAPVLAQALDSGTRRVAAFAEAQGAVTVRFPQTEALDPFFNINTPDDLAQVQRLYRTRQVP